MVKNKICLLYTGGTIGMVSDASGTLRPPNNPNDFLKFAPELGEIIDYDFEPLLNKDSTNMNPNDWTIIANYIYEHREKYSGFIVTHGTDTMHFTASAVAFALGINLSFPVVFTGAQTIPSVLHGDARINLLRAAKVALSDLAEVVISFGHHVYRGCRAQKKDERKFDAFESPAFYPIADIAEKILLHPTAQTKTSKIDKNKRNIPDIDLKSNFVENIVQLGLIPGLKPKHLEYLAESEGFNGLILQSFGAGNVPDEGEYAFGDIIKKLKQKNIPTLVTSQFPANSTMDTNYAPGKAAIDAGAIPTGNMTAAAATAKFRWVLAQIELDIERGKFRKSDKLSKIEEMMMKVYVGEM